MDIILLTTSLKAKNDVNKNSTSIDSPLIYGSALIGEMKRRAKILSYERGHPKILKFKFPPTFICSPISTILNMENLIELAEKENFLNYS